MKDGGVFGGLSYHGALRQILKELSLGGSGKGEEKTRKRHTPKKKKKEREMTTRSKASSKAAALGGILNSTGDGWVRYEPWELEGLCMYVSRESGCELLQGTEHSQRMPFVLISTSLADVLENSCCHIRAIISLGTARSQ